MNDPGVAFADLPPIDAVLITHNRYDHLDLATLRLILSTHRPRFIAPLGNGTLIAKAIGADKAELADWGDTIAIGHESYVTLVPAHHWSARTLGDRRMALWCGFVIQSPAGLVYNVGDTAFGDGIIFSDIASRFGASDIAILPIGAYEPRGFMIDQHVNPDEAVRILIACGALQGSAFTGARFSLPTRRDWLPRKRSPRRCAIMASLRVVSSRWNLAMSGPRSGKVS